MQLGSDDPLASAPVVMILVHGVGDHEYGRIFAAVQDGFNDIYDQKPPIVQVPRLLSNGTTDVVKVDMGEKTAFVFAVIWSRNRLRLVEGIQTYTSIVPLAFVWDSIPAFAQLTVNLFRCIWVTTTGWRRLVALLVASFGVSLLIGMVAVCLQVAIWHVGFVSKEWLSIGPTVQLFAFMFLIPFLLGLAWTIATHTLDLAADVVAYVGSKPYRDAQLSAIRRMLAEVLARAPRARVVVVGHSLGSIMVMNGLADLPEELHGQRRVLLVTVGSPYLRLARWFPGVVRSPEQLATAYEQARCIDYWVNLWRDQDSLGGSMEVKRPWFTEASLGEGGHSHYWSDIRMWARLIPMVRTDPSFGLLFRSWELREDTQGRQREYVRGIGHVVAMYVAAACLLLWLIVAAVYGIAMWPDIAASGNKELLAVVWVCAVVLWLGINVALMRLKRYLDRGVRDGAPWIPRWRRVSTAFAAGTFCCLAYFFWKLSHL